MNYKKFYPTAVVLYISYFIHGIGISILSQYKEEFASAWGAGMTGAGVDVSMVITVIAAMGIGSLISLPISGPVSDKYGRKISALIGIACYMIFFFGIVFAPNMYAAYACAIFAGIANSFLDTGVIPACLEILVKSGGLATMLTKLGISLGQLLLPTMIIFVAARNLPYTTLFYVMGAAILIDGILIAKMPFPPMNGEVEAAENKPAKKEKMKFTPTSIALVCIGFTSTATFQLWLNCNQELGKLYGVKSPAGLQTYYSAGTIIAILVTAVLVKKLIKPVRFLLLYPSIALTALVLVYLIQTPVICYIGAFVIGYAGAGGVLQLATAVANEMYPTNKGKITSVIMIFKSIENYTVITFAGYLTRVGGVNAPRYVLLLNIGITAIGIMLAVLVNLKYKPAIPVVEAIEKIA